MKKYTENEIMYGSGDKRNPEPFHHKRILTEVLTACGWAQHFAIDRYSVSIRDHVQIEKDGVRISVMIESQFSERKKGIICFYASVEGCRKGIMYTGKRFTVNSVNAKKIGAAISEVIEKYKEAFYTNETETKLLSDKYQELRAWGENLKAKLEKDKKRVRFEIDKNNHRKTIEGKFYADNITLTISVWVENGKIYSSYSNKVFARGTLEYFEKYVSVFGAD